jgi:hypothetical protein
MKRSQMYFIITGFVLVLIVDSCFKHTKNDKVILELEKEKLKLEIIKLKLEKEIKEEKLKDTIYELENF